MRQHNKVLSFLIAIVAAVSLAVPSVSLGDDFKESGKSRESGTWMTGDWHQHTFFTDGTNFMGDVRIDLSTTPPTFTILDGSLVTDPKAVFPAGDYKGVIPQGFRYGLDFQANSEHGGNRGSRDAFGRFWDSTTFYPGGLASIPLLGDAASYGNSCSYLTVDSPSCGSASHRVMWRWQELMAGSVFGTYMSAFDWITTLRGQYPDKQIMTGMEWNVPGHEHASSGCLDNDGKCVAEFEYRFDQNDSDATGPTSPQAIAAGINWTGKLQNSYYIPANGYYEYPTTLGLNLLHNKTIDGLAWLDANHPKTSWVNPAHIERAGCGFDYSTNQIMGGYSIAALRDMNDTAPTVFFGFEGMPGHQKASSRGEFSSSACGGGTYGGAGTYIATVGGVWDNLLADGRKIFNFVSSDFHMTRDDFYPGEYAKTYVNVTRSHDEHGKGHQEWKHDEREDGAVSQQDILNGMRSGNSFAVHGDLINELDFRVFHGVSVKNQSSANFATMGETLRIERGDRITVQIRFKSPSVNNNGDVPVVHHVQLIQGQINPTRAKKFNKDGAPNLAYNTIDPTVATIVETFDASSWRADREGFTTMTFTVPRVRGDMFFRIRGTNLGYGVTVTDSSNPPKIVFGTTNDAYGSPLINTPGTNSAAAVWKDLWFYSNPIFVHVK